CSSSQRAASSSGLSPVARSRSPSFSAPFRVNGRFRPTASDPSWCPSQKLDSITGKAPGIVGPEFDHVTIRVSDRASSERFYNTVLPTVGLEEPSFAEPYPEWGDFSLAQATEEQPVTRRLHVAFFAPSRAVVDEFWRVGTEAGYRDDGAPGPRPQYSPEYYGSFLLDPDGNSAEVVHHEERRRGPIDHLWIRVADLDASR